MSAPQTGPLFGLSRRPVPKRITPCTMLAV